MHKEGGREGKEGGVEGGHGVLQKRQEANKEEEGKKGIDSPEIQKRYQKNERCNCGR